MMEWKKVKLGEIADLKNGKKRPATYGTIPAYGGNGILDYVRESNNENCCIIGRVGAYCGCVYFSQGKCWVSDNAISASAKENSDNKFLFYLLSSIDLHHHHIGGAQPLMTQDIISRIEVGVPSIDDQRRIAAILSSLDAQIENNNRINANLEAQAQALFKSWFVDFEPWGGVMPVGWKEGKLTEIANYLNGLAMQKFPANTYAQSLPVLKIKELGQKRCDNSSDRCTDSIKSEYIIHNGDVVFSWSGTLLVDIWCGGKCGLNQHLFKVTSNRYPKWFYFLWTKHHLDDFINIAKDKAVTMGHIKRGHLDAALCNIPDADTMIKADAIFAPIIEEFIKVRVESARLAALRDTLLPKLMKGEIEL